MSLSMRRATRSRSGTDNRQAEVPRGGRRGIHRTDRGLRGHKAAAGRPVARADALVAEHLSRRADTAVRPRATQVSYTLNVAASVRFTVQRLGSGRKVAGRCVKPTNNNRRRTRCVRFVRLRGSFTRRRPAGPDRFAFNGDISNRGRLLTPARYRLLATPIAKSRTGAAAYAAFRIVR